MVSFNTDKRLIFPFFLITLAFFISTYLVADTYSAAGFELLKTAQARLEQIRASVADQDRTAASRNQDLVAAVAAAMKDLDRAAAGMAEMTAAHGEMTKAVANGIKKGRQWLERTARERSEQIGRILSGVKDGVNPEAAEQLESRIGDLPAAPESRAMADGLLAYETAYNGALEAVWKLMYRYPDTGEMLALTDQLDTLKNLSDTRRLAADLPDHGQLALLVKEAVAGLAAPDLEAAIRPLPESGQLLALLADRNQRIEDRLSALAAALEKGPGKTELTAGFNVLENLNTLDRLRDMLSALPSPESLTESLSRFPEAGPVRSAAGLLPQLPGRDELASLLENSVSPAALTETEKTVSGLLASDPVVTGLADHFPVPVPGELPQVGPVSEAMASVRNQLALTLKLSDPAGPEGVDPAGLAKESGKDIQAFINTYGEGNQGNRPFVLAVMGGFLGVMILCFLMVCLRLPGAPAGDRGAARDLESAGSPAPQASRAGEAVSQLGALEENLARMPGKLTEIRTMARENQDQSKDIFESAGIVHGNIRRVAGAMEQASRNLITISTAAEGITGSINEIVKNSESARAVTEEAVAETRNTTAKVSELGEAADSIDSVTHAINEISEQTNLLALNATIEAARAGEAGKGFAVVANEVKALARQTAEATEDISRKVAHINTITEEMVSQIERISDTIHNGNEMVTSIAQAVENQSVSTREIADNVGQASRGISEVSGKVSANLEFVSGILDNIGTVEKKSEALSQEANEAIELSRDQVALAEKLGRLLED